ncbi:opsin-3-like [Notothenia coriiceps]|uniref:Opsin-3-like n=1 Tax=Notothenia coriiceps TaxID=8208 RepID=A0A6I9MTF6_9TELE|nr:PREDICTED: opsin-3-like [Notothenia coriiceps]
MIVYNVSLSGCAGANSALCAAVGDGHQGGGSYRSTLSPTGNLLVAVCLGFIGTFGLLNNLLVLILFCRYKMLRSPINLLLINISISDLLVCVLGTPFSFAASTQGRWLIGEGGCMWYGFANSLFGSLGVPINAEVGPLASMFNYQGVPLNCIEQHPHPPSLYPIGTMDS